MREFSLDHRMDEATVRCVGPEGSIDRGSQRSERDGRRHGEYRSGGDRGRA